MVWRWVFVPCVLAAGCMMSAEDGLAGDTFMDDDLPPWSCMDDSGGGSTGACESSGGSASLECVGSADCPTDQVCSAVFDGEIGSFQCELVCVQNDDDAHWCFDDAACCDANASCVRGLCIAASDEGTDTTTGDATTGGADSSSSGEASSSSGAASSSDGGSTSTGGSSSGSTG